MTAQQSADTPPAARADGASPRPKGRRRPSLRQIMQAVLFVALAAGIFGVLPRLGGLTHEATGLRHARPGFLIAAIVAQAVSLGCYAQLYRQVLAALGARIRFRLAADVTLATFFVSHLTPLGSATGTLVNVNTLEGAGIDAATTSEAIGLTSLTSTAALIVLFGTGFAATAGRHVSHTYLVIAGIALFLVVAALAVVLGIGSHPEIAGRVPARLRAAGRGLRGSEHRQRHPADARRARCHRGHAGGHHGRLRRAAGHGGAGRTRVPDRELLAAAPARCRRLSPAQAGQISHGPHSGENLNSAGRSVLPAPGTFHGASYQ